jgi:hypothetical protein
MILLAHTGRSWLTTVETGPVVTRSTDLAVSCEERRVDVVVVVKKNDVYLWGEIDSNYF